MAAVQSLLPPNATALERALEAPVGAAIGALQVPLRYLWQPEAIPAALLPWFAWSLSVDEWDDAWTESRKRAAVAAAIALHRIKGTPEAVRLALAALGYGNAKVIDDCDGSIHCNPALGPYEFAIEIKRDTADPLTDAELAAIVGAVERYKNARSKLIALRTHTLLHNGAASYDATYTHNGGIVWPM